MSEPIRVAQVLNRMDSGGIEAVVMNYYRNIDRSKVQYDFYFAADSRLPQREELERLGAGLYPVPAYSKPFQYHMALYQAFRARGYSIVHAHLSTMSLFALFAAWRAGVPVRICHNHTTAHKSEGKRTMLKYLLRPFNKVFATDYFACGETAGRWMYGDRCFDAGKVAVLPNAIQTEKYRYDSAARLALRQELGLPQEAFVVGHVGRFMHQKNHRFLLQLFAAFAAQKPEAWLLLIGEGELQQEMEELAVQLGVRQRVIFTGARPDVNKLYSVMDVFCLPSYYEGMPLVAWEAQANGLQCLFADTISREAVLRRETAVLALEQPVWLQALQGLTAQRVGAASGEVPDIGALAHALQQRYAALQQK